MAGCVIQGLVSGVLHGLNNLIVFAAYALAMWYGAQRIIQGWVTPGDVIAIIGLALLAGVTFGQVGIHSWAALIFVASVNLAYLHMRCFCDCYSQAVRNMARLSKSRAALTRVEQVVSEGRTYMEQSSGCAAQNRCQGNIHIKDLHFHFPSRPDVQVSASPKPCPYPCIQPCIQQ